MPHSSTNLRSIVEQAAQGTLSIGNEARRNGMMPAATDAVAEPSPVSPWARMPLDGAPIEQILKSIECAMPVALIATSPVKTCRPSDRVDDVLRADEFAEFDHMPVRDENGNMIGVLGRKEKARRDTTVGKAMDELREPMLISA